MTLVQYKDWSPSKFDTQGLNACGNNDEDLSDWYVAPCILTRDSPLIEESNFQAVRKALKAAEENLGFGVVPPGMSEPVQVHSFGHWACGWFEIILVHPGLLETLEEIQDSLESYPVLDESDFSEREHEEAEKDWSQSYGGCHYLLEHLTKTFGLSGSTYAFMKSMDASVWREFHAKHSTHDYESHSEGPSWDFKYCDEKYAHWPTTLERGTLAAFLRAQPRKQWWV